MKLKKNHVYTMEVLDHALIRGGKDKKPLYLTFIGAYGGMCSRYFYLFSCISSKSATDQNNEYFKIIKSDVKCVKEVGKWKY